MKTLTLEESKARQLYNTGNAELREILIDSFGKEFFSEKITDRIKTFQDACDELRIDPDSIIKLGDTPDETAYKKLKVIIRALNEGWKPDWTNSNERKYYPWFEFVAGSGFRFHDFAYWNTNTNSGSRLCFKTAELAEYAAKQFQDLYNEYLILE